MISIVIPVYNSKDTLSELTNRIVNTLSDNNFEIIYINDGSSDGSLELLKELAKKFRQVRVISFSRNFGQHPAISAGFELARGGKIILMDADLQDRPENIPILLQNLKGDVDVVYTIRREKNRRFLTNISSNFFHYFVSKQIGVNLPKNIGTFRLFSRKILNALLMYKEVNVLYGPLMYYIGFNSCYVEVDRDPSPNNKSTYSFSKRLYLAFNTIVTYTDLPCRLLSYVGFLVSFLSVVYAFLVIIQYLSFGRSLPDGITMIIVILSFASGCIIFSIGIVGVYLFRIFQEVLHRPKYLINEIIESI